jgi:hypothetical protein
VIISSGYQCVVAQLNNGCWSLDWLERRGLSEWEATEYGFIAHWGPENDLLSEAWNAEIRRRYEQGIDAKNDQMQREAAGWIHDYDTRASKGH